METTWGGVYQQRKILPTTDNSTHCASIASASVSLTTRTGSFSSSASFAALRRRAPAITSYLFSSSSRTRRGARIPCVLKLAASSSRLFASKRLRGLVADSASAVIGTLRYSWLLTAFCVLGMIFSPLMCLWLGVRGLSAHVGHKNQTVQVLARYAPDATAAGSGPLPPIIPTPVCSSASHV